MCNHKSPRRGYDLSDSAAHTEDHQNWSRRSFLRTLGLAGACNFTLNALPITSLLNAPLTSTLGAGPGDRKLVLIRLKGGNDGLNTFVPLYQFEQYQQLRPTLGHAPGDLIQLNDRFALPQAMADCVPLWETGKMRVINSVGYPDHNLSHFTGADIMASGNSDVNENGDGWLARYYVGQNPDYLTDPNSFPPAVKIGGPTSVVFNDSNKIDISANFANTDQLLTLLETGRLYDNLNAPDNCYHGDQVIYLRTIANSASIYSTAIFDAYNNSETQTAYGSGLGEQLQLVARLIKGGLPTQLYLVTLDGFDTHVAQNGLGNHLGLLENLAGAVRAFYADLAASGHDQDVLSMTYSEFGRRVEENGVTGTDHGTALPVMLFGPALGGSDFHGLDPDLNELDPNGNLQFGTDFRSVYATLLQEWLCLDSTSVNEVLGADYQRLSDIGLRCSTTSVNEVIKTRQPIHRFATLGGGQYQISFDLPRAARVRVGIYTVSGKSVRHLTDQYYHAGTHQLSFSLAHLRLGLIPLIYTIDVDGQRYSGKFVVSGR